MTRAELEKNLEIQTARSMELVKEVAAWRRTTQQMASRLVELSAPEVAEVAEVQLEPFSVRFQSGELHKILAEEAVECLASGPGNSVEWKLIVPELGELTWTLQRVEGKTPAEQREEMKAQRDRAWEALEAALEWISAGIGCREGFFDGLVGIEIEPEDAKSRDAFSAGRRVAAVLAEARGEKGEGE